MEIENDAIRLKIRPNQLLSFLEIREDIDEEHEEEIRISTDIFTYSSDEDSKSRSGQHIFNPAMDASWRSLTVTNRVI